MGGLNINIDFTAAERRKFAAQEQVRNKALTELFGAIQRRDVPAMEALEPMLKAYAPQAAKLLPDTIEKVGQAGVVEGVLKSITTMLQGMPGTRQGEPAGAVALPQGIPETRYQKVPEIERRKVAAKADLEFQEENMERIVDVWVREQEGTFPTRLDQERQKIKLRNQIDKEIGSGKVKDLTLYNVAGDERKVSLPQSIADDPLMRQVWIDSNYGGEWSEVKVKEEQVSDLQLTVWQKALRGEELTPTEKQLINWEERPNLGRALQIVSRDPVFGKMGNVAADIKKVNAVAEILDMMSEKGIDIFQWHPNARYDHKRGQFYDVNEVGQRVYIEGLKENAPAR